MERSPRACWSAATGRAAAFDGALVAPGVQHALAASTAHEVGLAPVAGQAFITGQHCRAFLGRHQYRGHDDLCGFLAWVQALHGDELDPAVVLKLQEDMAVGGSVFEAAGHGIPLRASGMLFVQLESRPYRSCLRFRKVLANEHAPSVAAILLDYADAPGAGRKVVAHWVAASVVPA